MRELLSNVADIHENILDTIGQTPLVRLNNLKSEYPIQVYAKLESFNPGGSIKDRTAYNILTKALEQQQIDENTTIVESSSGNMAIGLAQACLYFGLKLIVVLDPNVNHQTIKLLKTYGAQIAMVQRDDEEVSYLDLRLKRVQQLLESIPNSFWPNQYANPENPRTHVQTMREIYQAMDNDIDYLFVATSTCGTLMGCADYIKAHNLSTKLMAVDAVGSVIFGTPPQTRLIPGHGAGRPSNFLDESMVHQAIHVSDKECVLGCHELLRREAILVGGSSGAIVSALKKTANFIPAGANCVLILSDRGERYLDTIYDHDWVTQHFGVILNEMTPSSMNKSAIY